MCAWLGRRNQGGFRHDPEGRIRTLPGAPMHMPKCERHVMAKHPQPFGTLRRGKRVSSLPVARSAMCVCVFICVHSYFGPSQSARPPCPLLSGFGCERWIRWSRSFFVAPMPVATSIGLGGGGSAMEQPCCSRSSARTPWAPPSGAQRSYCCPELFFQPRRSSNMHDMLDRLVDITTRWRHRCAVAQLCFLVLSLPRPCQPRSCFVLAVERRCFRRRSR